MSTVCWGFPLPESLYREVRETIRTTRGLGQQDIAQGSRAAFDLVSKVIFAAVNAYYVTPVEGRLPPLPDNLETEDAVQSIGLGLVFVAGRYLQGRSLQELKDLADYMDRLLQLHPENQQPYFQFPLDPEHERRARELLARARHAPDILALRTEVHSLIVDIAEASVVQYFRLSDPAVEQDSHLQQVVQYGIRDISDSVARLADQILPTLPPEHLRHFSEYLEAMFFTVPEGAASESP